MANAFTISTTGIWQKRLYNFTQIRFSDYLVRLPHSLWGFVWL